MRVLHFILKTSKPYCLYLVGICFAICIISIDTSVKPYLVKLLIDTVTSVDKPNIWSLVVAYVISQTLMMLAWTLSDWCSIRFNCNYRADISYQLTKKISHYSYHFFQNNLAGSVAAKINDVFTWIPRIIFIITHQFIQFGLTALFTLFFLVQIHIFFAIGLLVWLSCFLCFTYVVMKRSVFLTNRYAESKSTIWGNISDYLTNMLNVRLFATSDFEMDRLNDVTQDFVKNAKKQEYFMMNFYIVQGVVVSIYAVIFLLWLIYLQNNNLITSGDFALVFMLNFRMFDKLHELSDQLREFVANWGTVDQALTILDMAPEVQDEKLAQSIIVKQGEIVFKNVQFCYKESEPLFQNKSITIKPGQKIGLVGYSGGGKSTFVNLILRLYDVTLGSILIDGQDIRNVTQDSLHAAIGMIPQDPSLFHRSLMENIRYGRVNATDEEVIEAAKRAHAHDFISKLPQQYEALVGERGIKLSGGQRQRIAIARAILKNAPILILDEATSQLDSITENDIQDSLWELMQDKTTIIIAHRLSTLLHMDRILVFDQGVIIEDDTHSELLAKSGLYKILWNAQVGGFLLT